MVALADFNGDGKPDLAVAILEAVGAPKQLTILLGNGDGTFQSPLNSPTSDFPVALAAGDFNGDGKLDVAVSDFSGGIDILLGNGDGTFKPPATLSTAVYPSSFLPRILTTTETSISQFSITTTPRSQFFSAMEMARSMLDLLTLIRKGFMVSQ